MAEDFGFHKTDEVAASLDADITGVVVGFDMKINYLKMSKASIVVSRAGDSAVFIATNTDEQFPVRPGVFMPGWLDGFFLMSLRQLSSLSNSKSATTDFMLAICPSPFQGPGR